MHPPLALLGRGLPPRDALCFNSTTIVRLVNVVIVKEFEANTLLLLVMCVTCNEFEADTLLLSVSCLMVDDFEAKTFAFVIVAIGLLCLI